MIFVYIVKWFAIYTDISETDIMMYVNYTSIKNNFKKEIKKKGKKALPNGLLLDVSLSFVIMFSKDK